MVFSLSTGNDDIFAWKNIQLEIEKDFGVTVYYTRYNKAEKGGHFILNKHSINEAKIEEVI